MKVCGCGKEIPDDLEMCAECEEAEKENPSNQDREDLWDEIQVDDSGNLNKSADADKQKAKAEEATDDGFSDDETDPQGFSETKSDPAKSADAAKPDAEQTSQEDVETLRKRLHDTQNWGQKLSTEVAELKKMIQEGKATPAEIRGQQQVVEAAKKAIAPEALNRLYDEVPEAKAVVEPLLDLVNTLQGEVNTYKQSEEAKKQQELVDARKKAIEDFEKNVVPAVRKAHPDYDPAKLGEQGYFEWAEKQRPGMQFMALNSADPQDIVEAFTAFKKAMATPEAQSMKKKEEELKNQRMQNAISLRGGGGMHSSSSKKVDPNDRDAAWDDPEFDKKLKQDGLL